MGLETQYQNRDFATPLNLDNFLLQFIFNSFCEPSKQRYARQNVVHKQGETLASI